MEALTRSRSQKQTFLYPNISNIDKNVVKCFNII